MSRLNHCSIWSDDSDYTCDDDKVVAYGSMWEITGRLKYMNILANLPEKNGDKCVLHEDARKYDSLLELGSDWGHNFPVLYNVANRITGIDSAQISEDNAKVMHREASFVRGDIDALRFKDDEFDIVCSTHVLEHSSNVSRLVSEINRMTIIGGYSVHIVPSIMQFQYQECGNDFHWTPLNHKEWLLCFENHGFEIITSRFGWCGNQEDFNFIARKIVRYKFLKEIYE